MSNDSILRFPKYFPKNCPPPDAIDNEKVLFRICKGNCPCQNDFISFYSKNPKRYYNDIRFFGLSVFESFEDCNIARRKSAKLRDYKIIAYGKTNCDRGKFKKTPTQVNPYHITWWVYEGVLPHTWFVKCDKGGIIDG